MSAPRLILASASPRRIELLREAGFNPIVHPADIDESVFPPALTPTELASFLALAKAKAIAAYYPSDYTLGADTVVALGSTILGKPRDAIHAREMLQILSGSEHEVITGVAMVGLAGFTLANVTSRVQMRKLTDTEIDQYVATNLWQGKAGGYGIQDNDPYVTKMSGSLSNIVGLPMECVTELLAGVGIHPTTSHP